MAESHQLDVDRGVYVAIMLCPAGAEPSPIREFEFPIDRATNVAHLGTRLESADVKDVFAIPINTNNASGC